MGRIFKLMLVLKQVNLGYYDLWSVFRGLPVRPPWWHVIWGCSYTVGSRGVGTEVCIEQVGCILGRRKARGG